MKNVLLCGCGNIGFRHLQAMTAMRDPVAITIVEPFEAAHGRIAEHIKAAEASTGHRFALCHDIPGPPEQFDLAVIATSAPTRAAAYDSIVARHGVKVMILEKLLFQTLTELEAVGASIAEKGIKAFVNCGRRGFPGYHVLKAGLAGQRPLHLHVSGTQFGMASNTVHFLDLAEYLNDSAMVEVDVSGLQPGSVPSKRGGFVEVYGTITGRLANGATLRIDCLDEPAIAVQVAIKGTGAAVLIDEVARVQTQDGTASIFAARNVSEMPEFYQNALTKGDPGLTPYADSARQHRLFLTAMRDHLGLSNAADEPCPIS